MRRRGVRGRDWRKRRVCETVWLEEEKGVRGRGWRKRRDVRGRGWGSEGCERVWLEKRGV